MRNLYIFISRTVHAFLFIALAGISIYLIYKSSNYKQWIVHAWTKEMAGPVLKLQSNYNDWLHIRRENELLLEQNKNLLTIAFNHKFDIANIETVYHGDSLLFEYSAAKVIGSGTNKQNNYLILDKGTKDGIQADMGVISPQGMVGIIKVASPTFSVVLPIIHPKFSVFAKVGNEGASGMLVWEDSDSRHVKLTNLPHIEGVNVSDTIVTQHSLIFPPDYPIGVVEAIMPETIGGYFVVNVRLLVSFEKLRDVFIIKQKYSEELENLMNIANIDE